MELKVFDQVEKILRKETEEVRQDLRDILEKLKLGISFGPPTVKPLTSIHSSLYEIRIKDKKGQFRVIYFVKKKDAIYILHAFRKKTQQLPQKEKKVILTRIKEIK
jgi:phage-related protein